MSTLLEMVVKKGKPGAVGMPEPIALPILKKEHEGACGEGCGCGSEGGCCSS